MNEKLVRAIAEYVPLVAGFIFLVNKQMIASSVSLALYVPINQFNRRHEIEEIRKNIPGLPQTEQQVEKLVQTVNQQDTKITQIGQQLDFISPAVNQNNIAIIQIGQHVEPLSQIVNQNNIAIIQINQQLAPLSQTVEKHNTTIIQIGQQIEPLSQTVEQHNTEIQLLHQQLNEILGTGIDADVEQLVAEIEQLLQATRPHYKPLYNRRQSHEILKYALQEARVHLIMVCPWLNWDVINKTKIYEKLENKLNQNVQVDILYGYQEDVERLRQNGLKINRWNLLEAAEVENNAWRYDAIIELTKLENQYKDRFNLRLIGTHEKVLVCDGKLAMVGSHNFLTSYPGDKREFGLKTTDKNIISGLINRFENARNLEV